jgi:hypothetical protein
MIFPASSTVAFNPGHGKNPAFVQDVSYHSHPILISGGRMRNIEH